MCSALRRTETSVRRRHPQRYFSPILRTMRRSDATREPLWRSRSARETDVKEARSRFEALRKGASAPPVLLLTARRKLVHAHAHAAASTTRGTDSAACCSPSRSRRRLPRPLRPRAARAAGFRRPSLPGLLAPQARAAALAVGLRRGGRPPGLASRSRAASFRAPQARAAAPGPRLLSPLACAAGTPSCARLAFPRRELPRPLLPRAARAADSRCLSLLAPQARGPDGCSSGSDPSRSTQVGLAHATPSATHEPVSMCSRVDVARVCRATVNIALGILACQRSAGFDRAVNTRDCLVKPCLLMLESPKALRNP